MNRAQGVVRMLAYEDGHAAIEWLCRAFGFVEQFRLEDNGRVSHAELETGHGIVSLAMPTPAYEGPRKHRSHCESADQWLSIPWVVDGVLVYVDDVRSHFAQAKASGAVLLSEPEEGPPGLRYRAEDLEGHRWMFMEIQAS